MTNPHPIARVALVALFAIVLTACSSGSSGGGGGGSPTSTGGISPSGGSGAPSLTLQGLAFHPDTLTASAGEQVTITITNEDSVTHSFTLDDGSVTKDVPSGQAVDVTLTWPDSSTGFHCRFHSTMTGTLKVG